MEREHGLVIDLGEETRKEEEEEGEGEGEGEGAAGGLHGNGATAKRAKRHCVSWTSFDILFYK
jgi:hypothetical protein